MRLVVETDETPESVDGRGGSDEELEAMSPLLGVERVAAS